MHARLLGSTVTIHEADPVTCEHTELVGVFSWENGQLIGPGLSDTRRAQIAARLAVAEAAEAAVV